MNSSSADNDEPDRLQRLLDAVPAPLEPLDATMVDGFLCGVLLQPRAVPPARWLPHIVDPEGRQPPPGFDLGPLHDALLRRHAELRRAIAGRQWFDPWIYELHGEASPSQVVLPWVAGFATAMEMFPALLERHGDGLLEPLATLYMHLPPDALDDAEALRAEIDSLEPPADLTEAVEGLVRSVLLIADVSRPLERAKPREPS